jgi:hypothetical protein
MSIHGEGGTQRASKEEAGEVRTREILSVYKVNHHCGCAKKLDVFACGSPHVSLPQQYLIVDTTLIVRPQWSHNAL